MYLMHYEKFGDSSKGPSINDVSSEKEGGSKNRKNEPTSFMDGPYIHLSVLLSTLQ